MTRAFPAEKRSEPFGESELVLKKCIKRREEKEEPPAIYHKKVLKHKLGLDSAQRNRYTKRIS